jgi:hypothetical protein
MPSRAQKLLDLKKNTPLGVLKVLEDFENEIEESNQKAIEQAVELRMREIEKKVFVDVEKMRKDLSGEVGIMTPFLDKITQLKGDPGPQGEIGDPGPPGERGDRGSMGRNGMDGKDGKDGTNGTNGRDAKDGLPGKAGENGKDGKDITEVEPSKLWNILKPLKDLEVYVLNIAETVARREAARGGGGGGVGNSIPITEAVGSATTSITLASSVASNGRSIWLFYQGQWLVHDLHFTVKNKVVTFTYDDFVDGTFIDGLYIRT